MSTVHREVIGSDRRDESVMGPPPSGPNPPAGPRNVTGADSETGGSGNNKSGRKEEKKKSRKSKENEESDEDSDRRSSRHHRRSKHHRRRRSSSESSLTYSSDDEDDRSSYRRHNRSHHHHYSPHMRRRRSERYYYDKEYGKYYGKRKDNYYDRRPSRPSSRSGSVYEESYYHYDPYYAPPPAAMSLPPRDAMDTFEKHWRFYIKNPHLFYQLRRSDPRQYDSLVNYYRLCGEYLALPPIGYPVKSENHESESIAREPSERASVHSGQSSIAEGQGHGGPSVKVEPNVVDPDVFQEGQAEVSNIWTDPNADPRYQPTFREDVNSEMVNNNVGLVTSSGRVTPNKFSSAHAMAAFGIRGHLAKVEARNPLDGQAAIVELCALQSVFPEKAEEFSSFPGPLVPGQTHKGEVIQFCQSKLAKVDSVETDRDSYKLMWELMIMLLKSKNSMDGSDLAELLLRDRDSQEDRVKFDKSGITMAQNDPDVTSKFRDFLLLGHKKEGLEFAMRHGLWGHALFLASKMDDKAYSTVMLRFANGLAVNDPLQTLYQLMSGRQPIAVKDCAEQHWGGDWRPHLAMILANPSGRNDLDQRSILTLGDTLRSKGLIYGAHFCYLMARAEFGGFSEVNAKISLLGSDRSLQQSFESFASNEAIQLTETFEYAQRLANPESVIKSMLYYKFIYALRLLDCGMTNAALDYLIEISGIACKRPESVYGDRISGSEFLRQVLEVSDRLKYLDPSYATGQGEINEMADPEWLTKLKEVVFNMTYSNYNYYEYYGQQQNHPENEQNHQENHQEEVKENDVTEQNHQGEKQNENPYDHPEQLIRPLSLQNNEIHTEEPKPDESERPDTPIMMRPVSHEDPPPEPVNSTNQVPTFQPNSLPVDPIAPPPMPPVMANPVIANPVPLMTQPPPESSSEHATPNASPSHKPNYFSQINSKQPEKAKSSTPNPEPSVAEKRKVEPEKSKNEEKKEKKPGMFGRLLGSFIKPPNQMHLPDDSDQTIVYDEARKMWVDKNADPDEQDNNVSAAPPSDMELSRNNSEVKLSDSSPLAPPGPGGPGIPGPPLAGGNKFAGGLAKKRGMAGRIDVFKKNQSAPALNSLSSTTPSLPPMIPENPVANAAPPKLFVPAPIEEQSSEQTTPENQGTAPVEPPVQNAKPPEPQETYPIGQEQIPTGQPEPVSTGYQNTQLGFQIPNNQYPDPNQSQNYQDPSQQQPNFQNPNQQQFQQNSQQNPSGYPEPPPESVPSGYPPQGYGYPNPTPMGYQNPAPVPAAAPPQAGYPNQNPYPNQIPAGFPPGFQQNPPVPSGDNNPPTSMPMFFNPNQFSNQQPPT